MNIQPIHTKTAYKAALKRVSQLVDLDPKRGTALGDELAILGTLVQAFEAEHYPIDLPDPIEAIKFRMEQQGLEAKDLQPMIGGVNRVYEVLNRKRPLSLAMVRRLHAGLGISAACLIRESVVA
ncbi:MAG: transcriptional regulator [Brachymonas sp.]|nr:transcriptional regulator [Brachymonas sp.]NJS35714.1 transcriptional regulator [Brachymonas sp.]